VQGAISHFINAALKARYLTLVATVVVIVAGVIGWKILPLEAYPELANPQVRIITLYPGKGAEEVERLITVPLEKELNGIPGQTALRSLSVYGLSVVTTTFLESVPTTLARQQVLERIAEANIPPDAHPELEPDVGSLREIYRYSLHSPYYGAAGLRAIQQWELEKAFRQIPGVAGVVSQGGRTKTYEVNVDPMRLKAQDISLDDLYDALTKANATTGGGFISKNGHALIVRELGLISSLDDIRDVVIKSNEQGIPIKVGDVADVAIGSMVRRGQVGMNDEDDVVEGIVLLRRGENPSRVLDNIYAKVPSIKKRLPQGVHFDVLYDRSGLVTKTLNTVGTNVAIGISLVVLLLWIFLVDFRSALITACVLPISVLVAFICLNLFGVPANLLSLGAIDFGILVDSAIVMVENIMRRLSEEGRDLSPRERLYLLNESAREVGSPIVFGIAVIVATFLPIFSFTGVEGKLFRPLATTMVTALIGAGAAALALIPVLCSFVLTNKPLRDKESFVIDAARHIYRPTLGWALKNRWLVILTAAACFAGSVMVFMNLGSEFLPHLEEGNIWLRATIKPASVDLDNSVQVASEIRKKLTNYPEVIKVLSQAGGPDDGSDPSRFADQEYYVDLKPAKDWRKEFHENKDELIAAMRKDLSLIPGVSYYFTQYIQTTLDEALSGVQGSLVAKISGPELGKLEGIAQRVGNIMTHTKGIVDVIVDPLLGQPQVSIEFDREKASRYGLNVDNLRSLVEIAIGGKSATTVLEGERRFELMVRLKPEFRSSEAALREVLIDTPTGAKIPLSEIATVTETNGATQIWRDAGSRLATIRANVRGRDLATAVNEAQKRVDQEVNLPEGYAVQWSGEFQRQREASHQLAVILPVTLAVIITILYLACGTLRGALVMFSVVPLAAIGGILALWGTHTYMSISAGVGFIALFGLAVKNGILLVSFVNELRQEGMEINEAVYKGALIRVRPVLMTAVIATAGLLPAAFSNEIGSQTQKPFAIVIIGGLISCTFLTLYVLPALYISFAPKPGKTQGNNEPLALRDVTGESKYEEEQEEPEPASEAKT
jgi:cobalt-zinc-cadmium resistance protein CzcA